jgi:hypothetical protein
VSREQWSEERVGGRVCGSFGGGGRVDLGVLVRLEGRVS